MTGVLDLIADFARKGWHNRVELTGAPEVEYVGLVNRADEGDDRVVVRIGCAMRDYVETRVTSPKASGRDDPDRLAGEAPGPPRRTSRSPTAASIPT